MAITITKNLNGNVSFDDGTVSWSYVEPYSLRKEGDFVYVINELSKIPILTLDFNDVTSVTDSAGGTVNTTTAQILYDELLNNVFFKTV